MLLEDAGTAAEGTGIPARNTICAAAAGEKRWLDRGIRGLTLDKLPDYNGVGGRTSDRPLALDPARSSPAPPTGLPPPGGRKTHW